MQYAGPLDQPGFPNADYVDGNPAAGVQGSIVPAAAVENPQREIVQTIADCLLSSPSNLDLTQLSSAVRFMRPQYALDTGVTNLVAITLSPAPAQWVTPLMFYVLIANSNTSQTVGIQIAGLTGQKPVVKRNGASVAIGDLAQGSMVLMAFDGTSVRCLSALASDVGSSVGGGGPVNLRVFTSSGTYTPTLGALTAIAFATGGGGGGGGYDGTWCQIATSGVAGATAISLIDLSGVVSLAVTIGAGGTGGLSSAANNTQAGSGGTTSLGSVCSASGGPGGWNSYHLATIPYSDPRGTPTGTGLIILPGGAPAAPIITLDDSAGQVQNGGESFWGGGAGMGGPLLISEPEGVSPLNATGYGNGGGAGGATFNGSNGSHGLVMVIEF